jgi:Transposase DDE domain group 1
LPDSSESPTYGEQEGGAYKGILAAPAITRCSYSTSSAIWSDALHARGTRTAPMVGARLEPVVARYRGTVERLYFRGDAAFAHTEIYEFIKAEGIGYTIRLPANSVPQDEIGYLLKRPVGRPPLEVRRYYASFSYQAQSWKKPRRVVSKVEWHPDELYPRIGFIVTNLSRPTERIVAFYNQRGTMDQRGQGRDQIDFRPPSDPLARLQSWRPHAHAGDAAGRGAVVADQPAREADQDRRQGPQPRPLRHLPIDRGLSVAADVCGNLVADWPVARPPEPK